METRSAPSMMYDVIGSAHVSVNWKESAALEGSKDSAIVGGSVATNTMSDPSNEENKIYVVPVQICNGNLEKEVVTNAGTLICITTARSIKPTLNGPIPRDARM